MYIDLEKIGFKAEKKFRVRLPNFVRSLVNEAKENEKYQKEIQWCDLTAGQTALAFLLGYFDGDGSYMTTLRYPSADAGVIYSTNRDFLEDIKEVFGFTHEVKSKLGNGDKSYIFDRILISKGYYYLFIDKRPINLLYKMFQSFQGGLARKRPNCNTLGNICIEISN
jgi:hypothetical protein